MKLSSLLLASLIGLSSAMATTIYDNGSGNLASGNEMTAWLQAEDFSLSSASSIGSAQFWTIEDPNAIWDGSLQWTIFSDIGGTPASIVATGNGSNITKTATGNSYQNWLTEYIYEFDLSTPVLSAGTTYWFGLHLNKSYNNRANIYWESSSRQSPNGQESYGGTLDNWFNNGQEHAFNLSGGTQKVPDGSSTLVLLSLSTVGILALARRSKA